MFISLNELKGMIIDLDSFEQELDMSWSNLDSSILILFYSDDIEKLERVKGWSTSFLTYKMEQKRFLLNRHSFIEMHRELNLESHQVATVSADLNTINKLQGLNLSTIYYSKTSVLSYEKVGNLADFMVDSVDEVSEIINGQLSGYFSEVASNIQSGGFNKGLLIVTEKVIDSNKVTIVSGGRYFSSLHDTRYPVHQLSQRIIRSKTLPESQSHLFSSIYSSLIRFIEENLHPVEVISRVPPRPGESKDRFIDCVSYICKGRPHIENAAANIYCIKDYKKQKPLNREQRFLNIDGVFEVRGNYTGRHVVILDDVMTTGATALEAAKQFYFAGAVQVTILVLAINQMQSMISTSYNPLKCGCGAELKMRFNRQNNSAFFGCPNYQECQSKAVPINSAIKSFNVLNKLNLEEDELEDFDIF